MKECKIWFVVSSWPDTVPAGDFVVRVKKWRKKIKFRILSIILISVIILISLACTKPTEPSGEKDLSVVIQNFEVYEYKTGIAGDEEGVIITQQAKHYEISEIVRGKETSFEAVYRYKPEDKFKGVDSVELEKQTGSDGSSPPTKFEKIKIIITVK